MVSGTAFAVSGEPLPFDSYSVLNGEITPTGVGGCPQMQKGAVILNTTCGDATISDGMLQREVTVSGSGDAAYDGTYIQFILTESGASGDPTAAEFTTERGSLYFTSEDFIKMNNRGEGIASQQKITESVFDDATFIEDRFDMTTKFKMGWAQGGGTNDPWVDMVQGMSQIQYDNTKLLATTAEELYGEEIIVKSVGPGLNNTYVEMSQRIVMQEDDPLLDGVQKFKHTRVSGGYNDLATNDGATPFYINTTTFMLCAVQPPDPLPPECAEVTPPAGPNANPLLAPFASNGGNIDWIAGDSLTATWIGVDMPAIINGIFGLTHLRNLTQNDPGWVIGVDSAETRFLSFTYNEAGGSIGTWDAIENAAGDPMFGAAEAMGDVAAVSMTDFSVMATTPLFGAANLDYRPNSDPTLAAPLALAFSPDDADYDQWKVANGVFTAQDGISPVPCPAAADSCGEAIVNEGGMYQRTVVVAGETYFQTIMVADGDVTGDPQLANFAVGGLGFKSENFVKGQVGLGGTGIASRTHIDDAGDDAYRHLSEVSVDLPSNGGQFVNDVELKTGWANAGSVDIGGGVLAPDPVISVLQSLLVEDDITLNATSMSEQFTMERGATANDKKITLTSIAGTRSVPGDGLGEPVYVYTETTTGAYQQSESTVLDPFVTAGTGEALYWSKGDALRATWVGGEYSTHPAIPFSSISATSIANLTTSEQVVSTSLEPTPTVDSAWGAVIRDGGGVIISTDPGFVDVNGVDPFTDTPEYYPYAFVP